MINFNPSEQEKQSRSEITRRVITQVEAPSHPQGGTFANPGPTTASTERRWDPRARTGGWR